MRQEQREIGHCCLAAWRYEKGPQAKEPGWPPAAGEGKDTDGPLEPPRGPGLPTLAL